LHSAIAALRWVYTKEVQQSEKFLMTYPIRVGRSSIRRGSRTISTVLFAAYLTFLLVGLAQAQIPGKTLIVVAHPDDEYYFAASVYRMAVQLKGTVDELVITNGEGGFHYSTLAEPFYGKVLATEESGRKELPEIRREETLRAGKILGIRDHFFLEQKDQAFTTDRDAGLKQLWNSAFIEQTLLDLIKGERYQYVFAILPRATTHGHHQAATAIALRAIDSLPIELRPVLLGFDTDAAEYVSRAGFAEENGWETRYAFAFDRNAHFGYNDALTYQVVVSWMITEHKSQGLLQTMHNKDATEFIWTRVPDTPKSNAAVSLLFHQLVPA
jgi:N-acetylglucosamine malate deacetylase 2